MGMARVPPGGWDPCTRPNVPVPGHAAGKLRSQATLTTRRACPASASSRGRAARHWACRSTSRAGRNGISWS